MRSTSSHGTGRPWPRSDAGTRAGSRHPAPRHRARGRSVRRRAATAGSLRRTWRGTTEGSPRAARVGRGKSPPPRPSRSRPSRGTRRGPRATRTSDAGVGVKHSRAPGSVPAAADGRRARAGSETGRGRAAPRRSRRAPSTARASRAAPHPGGRHPGRPRGRRRWPCLRGVEPRPGPASTSPPAERRGGPRRGCRREGPSRGEGAEGEGSRRESTLQIRYVISNIQGKNSEPAAPPIGSPGPADPRGARGPAATEAPGACVAVSARGLPAPYA